MKPNIRLLTLLTAICLLFSYAFLLPLHADDTAKKAPSPEYLKVRKQFGDLYKAGKFPEAARLMEKNIKRFPDNIQATAWNTALAYGKVNKFKRGIKALAKAQKAGIWYNIWAFKSPAWKSYRAVKAFKKILDNERAIET
ncbi:MAG: hypothetical protein GY765_04145 [bacterium]|nr:hypothetical protein [bacterium]